MFRNLAEGLWVPEFMALDYLLLGIAHHRQLQIAKEEEKKVDDARRADVHRLQKEIAARRAEAETADPRVKEAQQFNENLVARADTIGRRLQVQAAAVTRLVKQVQTSEMNINRWQELRDRESVALARLRIELDRAQEAMNQTLREQESLKRAAPKVVPRPKGLNLGTGKAAEAARAYECLQPSVIGPVRHRCHLSSLKLVFSIWATMTSSVCKSVLVGLSGTQIRRPRFLASGRKGQLRRRRMWRMSLSVNRLTARPWR